MFQTPYQIIQFIIGLLGAITTIACFIPQGIKTFLSKDTSGLSKWFFITSLICSLFWLTLGSMAIASPWVHHDLSSAAVANALSAGLPPIITNVVTLLIDIGILIIKVNNINKAKALNMTEADYCNTIATKNRAAKL